MKTWPLLADIHRLKSLAGLIFLLATTALTQGLAPSPAHAQSAQKVVNVYSSRHYDVDEQIHRLFTAKTGIQVQHVQIKEASHLIERVKAEGAKSQADAIMTVDIGNLWRAADAGILADTEIPDAAAVIAPSLRDGKGRWYAISQRARVLVYHRDRIKPEEIATYESLAEPKFAKRILVRSSNHVYNQSLIASLTHHLGKENAEAWVQGVAKNLARKPEGGDTDQIKAIAAGVGDVAIVNSYYVARLLRSTKQDDQKVMERIGVVFPNHKQRGTHVNVSGIGVAKHAPNRESAITFLKFLLTPEVQALYAQENGEYPVLTSVPLPEFLGKLGALRADTASLAAIGELTPTAVMMTDRSTWR